MRVTVPVLVSPKWSTDSVTVVGLVDQVAFAHPYPCRFAVSNVLPAATESVSLRSPKAVGVNTTSNSQRVNGVTVPLQLLRDTMKSLELVDGVSCPSAREPDVTVKVFAVERRFR